MRSYHDSEIAHKKDAVDILKSILTASILVYGGLFGLLLKENISVTIVQLAGLATIAVNSFIAFSVVKKTNEKIRKDNIQYCLHFFEYRKEREILNLDKDLEEQGFESKSLSFQKNHPKKISYDYCVKDCTERSENISLLSGHNDTQKILLHFATMIFVICFIGFIGLVLLGYDKGLVSTIISIITK
jgi:hypothetical protein